MRLRLDANTKVYEPFFKFSKARQMKYIKNLPHVKTDEQAESLFAKLPVKKNKKKSKDV